MVAHLPNCQEGHEDYEAYYIFFYGLITQNKALVIGPFFYFGANSTILGRSSMALTSSCKYPNAIQRD